MKKIAFALFSSVIFATSFAGAQTTMPAPRAMPRVPVSQAALGDQRESMPASRQVQGLAAIIDGERLRVSDLDLRLFGIVPPQLAASFGPQARTALDGLANGQSVACQIRDRDRDGRLLATCSNSSGVDMALELLRRGLAVTARGSLAGTELATSYLSAEQNAQNQKLGLWSTTVPSALSNSASPTIMPSAAVKQEVATLAAALPSFAETKREEKAAIVAHPEKAAADSVTKVTNGTLTPSSDAQAKIAADVVEQHAQAQQVQLDQTSLTEQDDVGFFERYQILIAGLLMLATALSIIGALWGQKRRDKRDEIKAVAAALRGELMAARGICAGRIKAITNAAEDLAMTWPRIRITLYQAYVGRLGLLGAEIARQIASVYGQSSDYASLYNPSAAPVESPKRQALENLVRNVDEILPKLAFIEQSGRIPAQGQYSGSMRSVQGYTTLAPSYGRPLPTPMPLALKSDAAKNSPRKLEMSPELKTAEQEMTEPMAPRSSSVPNAIQHPVTPPTALWEAVRGFIQSHRNAIQQIAPQNDSHLDPHVAEYAAMIEADMARYRYAENSEPLDLDMKKKQG